MNRKRLTYGTVGSSWTVAVIDFTPAEGAVVVPVSVAAGVGAVGAAAGAAVVLVSSNVKPAIVIPAL